MDAKLLEQVELLEELNRRNREDKLARYKPYEKQKAWHDMSAEKRCSALLAGNQGGKSYAAAMQVAIFATGRYPEWWQGKRFSSTTRGWVAGISSVGVRDTMQRLLLGPLGNQGTGAIPKDCIEQVRMSRGSPDAVDSILVRHVNGYTSQITFKSYEQGITRLAGETLNYVCMDEEPPADVFSECLARISATRGIVFASFTPLLGMSEIVRRFLDGSNPDYGYVQFALDEAGHFTREEKEKIEAGYQPFERDARVHGIPMLGSGRVFQVAEEMIRCEAFTIPRHWSKIAGLDVGIEHPTAVAWLAVNRDTDCIYVFDTHRLKDAPVAVHAEAIKRRGASIPLAYPHDAVSREAGSGHAQARRRGVTTEPGQTFGTRLEGLVEARDLVVHAHDAVEREERVLVGVRDE